MKTLLYLLALFPFVIGQIGDPFGGTGGFFSGLLASLLGAIQAALAFLWNVLVFVANYLLAVIRFVWQFTNALLGDALKLFRRIWHDVIKVALTKAVQVYVRVQAWLQKTFGPLVKWLQKVRKWYDHYFNLYVKPILNAIQHVRQVLQIFRLLGFKWAAKLDALLGKIQTDIVKAYELIRQNLNQLTSWIQLIIDPTFLLRRVPLLGSILRSVQEINNALLRATQRPLTPEEQDALDKAAGRYTKAGRAEASKVYYSKGQLPPNMVEHRASFKEALKAFIS